MANELEIPETIQIVGSTNTHRYKDVKDVVVKIGTKFYYKHDPSLIRLPNSEGKTRFFRKDSPYLETLADGELIHKSQVLSTDDGILFKKGDSNFVQVDGKWTRKSYAFEYNGKWYYQTNDNFVYCHASKKRIPKNRAILLSQEVYGNDYYIDLSYKANLETTKFGSTVYAKDVVKLMDSRTGETFLITSQEMKANKIQHWGIEVFLDFQDKTNPQESRLNYIRPTKEAGDIGEFFEELSLVPGGPRLLVNKNHLDYVNKCIETYIMPRYSAKLEEIKKKLNSNFSDLDPSENTAKVFKIINQPFPGKSDIYRPLSYAGYVNKLKGKKINSFKFTGGLKYSYGIEFETSQGLIPAERLEDLRLHAVGDRSIGAGEYVTLPMEGDAGIEWIGTICEALANYTLIDDRCGLHVHVGGLSPETKPSFSKEFIKNAVNLGCFIEEELYKCMPESRKPTLYHCHSIQRFGPVTDKNFDENIGAYIFGEKEHWVDEKGRLCELWPFSRYKLGAGRNANSNVGTWADGRYKWLNLIHSYLNHGPRTIEFRIFPGTVSKEKTYAYLLFSLAFTHIIDNHPQIIKKGTTLEEMFSTVFKKYPAIRNFAIDFYEKRKARFNRKNIYPKIESLTFLK